MTNKATEQKQESAPAIAPKRNAVHIILQGKGGVGKSYVSSLLAQYLLSKGVDLFCVDTDPVNATFTAYNSLKVAHVDILDDSQSNIVQRKFDTVMEKIIETDANFVMDNGSSSFLSLSAYLAENGIFDLLNETGKDIYVHTVIIAGQERDITYSGFETLTKRVNSNAKIVVWENELHGPVLTDEGTKFADMDLYKANKSKVAGIVKIAHQTSDTFVTDIQLMTSKHLTLNDVKETTDFGLISKSRIHRTITDVFAELDKVNWK